MPSQPGTSLARLVLSGVLGLLLLSATLYNTELYALLDRGWQRVIQALGLAHLLPRWLQAPSAASTLLHQAHSIPAVVLYSVIYIGLCGVLFYLLVPTRADRRVVVLFYGGAGLAAGLLLLSSRWGSFPVLAVLASQLLHFVVSPLPVMVLVPLLRWGGQSPRSSGRS